MESTTRINVINKEINGVFVAYTEIEIGYEAHYCPEEKEMGHVREPAHLEIDHIYDASYIDSEIYFVEDRDEIELDPIKDKPLFKMAEEIIIDWVIENMTETIEDSIHEDNENRSEIMAEYSYERRRFSY